MASSFSEMMVGHSSRLWVVIVNLNIRRKQVASQCPDIRLTIFTQKPSRVLTQAGLKK